MRRRVEIAAVTLTIAALGCRGAPTARELEARDVLERADATRSAAIASEPSALDSDATFEDFARHAALRSPAVAERFALWSAEVERITIARSLDDPTITLEGEIDRVLTGLAIGIAGAFPWPGKLALAADASSGLAEARRHEFESEVASAIATVRAAYVEAAFNEESIVVARDVERIVDELVELTRTRLRVAQIDQLDLLRIEIERDQLRNEIASLEDGRNVLRARLKSALGIAPTGDDPPLPVELPRRGAELPSGDLFAELIARNPKLSALEAEIRSAESLVALARRSAYPDFLLGVEGRLTDPVGVSSSSPLTVSPEVGITLPIFRDKIDATIAAALADQRAARARLEGERLRFVVELASALFLYRDSERRIALTAERLLPKAQEALVVARTGYGSGAIDLTALLDAERNLRAFQLGLARARLDREVACARIEYEMLARVPRELRLSNTERTEP
ncbi:MAG: TolC family protein [Planctomycetes bacterium]|nr:TolC family protein [Planctomycetota bacterium]